MSGELDDLQLIAHLRNALAASAIEQVKPDLVIFDEFQRFRDLLDPQQDEAAQRVIGRLRGDGSTNPPALLPALSNAVPLVHATVGGRSRCITSVRVL